MSHEQFVQALNKIYKIDNPEQLEGIKLQHYKFASGTNARGLKFIESMEKRTGFRFQDAKVLDIGCAYGGFCIEAARKGAQAFGIDISRKLLDLARINAKDEKAGGEIRFFQADITGNDFVNLLPRRFFDLIVVNDVFEHVYDTAKMLQNVSEVTSPEAVLYFKIPNGMCSRFIRKEGHSWVPGVSVLDPSSWHHRVESFNIYYRRWDYYAALLTFFGFKDIRLLNFEKTFAGDREQLEKHLQAEFESLRTALTADLKKETALPQRYKDVLSQKLLEVQKEMRDDLKTMPDAGLCWKYLITFWEGIAVKHPDQAAAIKPQKTARAEGAPPAHEVLNSFAYRLGDTLVQAVRKPGRNTLWLPYRLFRLCAAGLRRRMARAAGRPEKSKSSAAAGLLKDSGTSKLLKPAVSKSSGVDLSINAAAAKPKTEEFVIAGPAPLPPEEADQAKTFWSGFSVRRDAMKAEPWSEFLAGEVLRFSPSSVFEFGCYNGRNLMAIHAKSPGVVCSGIDINPEAVAVAQKAGLTDVREGDEKMLPALPDMGFDVCFTSSVLDHMPMPFSALIELIRISKKACLFYEPFLGKEGKVVRNFNVEKGGMIETTPFSYSWDYLRMIEAANGYAFQGRLTVQVITHPIKSNLGRFYRLYIVHRRFHAESEDRSADSIFRVHDNASCFKRDFEENENLREMNNQRNITSFFKAEVMLDEIELSSATRMIKSRYVERLGQNESRIGSYYDSDWKRIEYISRLLPEGISVLDVGVGNGAFINLLASLRKFQRIIGIDIKRHSNFMDLFENKLFKMLYASIINLPFINRCFDCVTCMEVLEHLEKESLIFAIHELRRISKSLIVTVPYNEPEPLPSHHKMKFKDQDYLSYFPNAEFTLLKKQNRILWMLVRERQ